MAANDNVGRGARRGSPWLAIVVSAFLIAVAVAGFVAFATGHADARQFGIATVQMSGFQPLQVAA